MWLRYNRAKSYLVLNCFTLLLVQLVFAQKDYKAIIIDRQTGNPIPYVNIGIVGEGIGTVSNESGIFHLELDQQKLSDKTILISCLGYFSQEIPVKSVKKVFNEYPKIFMEPRTYSLKEVVVTNRDGHYVNEPLGYQNFGEKVFGYWKGSTALGAELATKIRVRKGHRRLNALEFEVWHSTADSVQIRVNVYDVDSKNGGKPGENLNKSSKNILYTIKEDTKIAKIDLKPFGIYVDDDFIIALELLEMHGGSEIELMLAGTFNRPDSFRRYVSLDKWERLSFSMAYYVSSEVLVDGPRLARMERKVARTQNSKQYINGFVFELGRPLSGVNITNTTNKTTTETDEDGRYKIEANFGDVLHFAKTGFSKKSIQVGNKPTLTVNLLRNSK